MGSAHSLGGQRSALVCCPFGAQAALGLRPPGPPPRNIVAQACRGCGRRRLPTARLRTSFVDARQRFLGHVVVGGSAFEHSVHQPDVKFKIEIEDDFMARQTRAEPVRALAKVIGTALTRGYDVEFQFKDWAQGMSKIVVYDDGGRIPRDHAKLLFGHLGGPWKRMKRPTECRDRMVHSQEGRGRYKTSALGTAADWKVCYLSKGEPISLL